METKTRVLVTGYPGQLARCIEDEAVLHNSIECEFTSRKQLDISGSVDTDIAEMLREKKISYVINCAAYTDVARAEEEDQMMEVSKANFFGPYILASACKLANAVLVHISTDYVFDGKKSSMYNEIDETNPLSLYGRSKRDGENQIKKVKGCKHIIVRTSWLYSEYGKGFLSKIIEKLEKCGKGSSKDMEKCGETDVCYVTGAQVGSPTYARDLAKFLLDIISDRKTVAEAEGETYHFCDLGIASRYDFAEEICSCWSDGKCKDFVKLPLEEKEDLIRPAFSAMSAEKARAQFKCEIPYWRDSLRICLERTKQIKDKEKKK